MGFSRIPPLQPLSVPPPSPPPPPTMPPVPETILKRRKRDEAQAKAKVAEAARAKKDRRVKRSEAFKRAEKYAKEYRSKAADEVRLHRIAKKNGSFHVPAEPKLVFMIRIRGINGGSPNVKSVKELIYKRGYAKVNRERQPIKDNAIIERSLGRHNIICVEDLVHEIFTVGPHFKEATNFLWPFKLNNPTGGWVKKGNHFIEGGDFGNRENEINALLRRMV